MSLKSLIQVLLLSLIILIIAGIYYKYFITEKNIVEEIDSIEKKATSQIADLEKKISDLELSNKKLSEKIIANNENSTSIILDNKSNEDNKKDLDTNSNSNKQIEKNKKSEKKKDTSIERKKIKNLVKDIEYTSIDQKGNRFYLLATSGKSNPINNDILDLENVRGKITSDIRDTIYIISDFAQYNSINLNSKFYENVIINYQDKEITCINFDINMETNKAIAYNNVIITDPKSEMKAGIVEFDLKTKNIEINPETTTTEIEVISN